jgi:predicted nicotinamide N-methyase
MSHLVDGYRCTEVYVSLGGKGVDKVIILEADADAQEKLIEVALQNSSKDAEEDPYGSVLWPAAKTVSLRILNPNFDLHGKRVLELGTGTGLVAMAAAMGGASSVLATDYNSFALSLLEKAATLQKVPPGILKTQFLDVKDESKELPPADIVLVADMLYDPSLAVAVGKRVCEAYNRGSRVIVGNSPQRPGTVNFLRTVKEQLGFEVKFEPAAGFTVTGHRHDLISGTNTDAERPLETTILELHKKTI